MASTPLFDAASSSMMLREVPALKARQDSHSLHASPSAVRCSQLMVLANILAQDVLPTPREPQKRYECANRLVATAFLSVAVSAFWPTTEANVAGRYLRAETMYCSIRPLFVVIKGEILQIQMYGNCRISQTSHLKMRKDSGFKCLNLGLNLLGV